MGNIKSKNSGSSCKRFYDVLQVYSRVPDLLGMEMRLVGGVWEGRYYIDGRRHAYKRDKLRVKIYDAGSGNDIWIHEQGGRSVSLATWLVQYGGASDYKSAYRIIGGSDVARSTDKGFVRSFISESSEVLSERYVEESEYEEYLRYDLWACALYRWMSGLFGSVLVKSVWDLYGVTTDERGLVVWWYYDADGRICYDKRMRYSESGNRDKSFGGTRKYRVGDGFTLRPMFGSHILGGYTANLASPVLSDGVLRQSYGNVLPNIENALRTQKINIVESEKTALLCKMAFGGVWLATGGKGNLRDIGDDMLLWPDIDAVSDWSERGEVCEWWLDAESCGAEIGEKWDIGDFIVNLKVKNI